MQCTSKLKNTKQRCEEKAQKQKHSSQDNASIFSFHTGSARRISSSYNVHARAELIAFLPTRSPRPSKKLLKPSSLIIIWAATNMLPYLPGMSCKRVLIASKGLVRVVARHAARIPDKKLIEIDLVLVISFCKYGVSILYVAFWIWLSRFLDCS